MSALPNRCPSTSPLPSGRPSGKILGNVGAPPGGTATLGEAPDGTPASVVPLVTQVHDLEALHEATLRFARNTDPATGLRDILEATLRAIGASQGLLSAGEADGQELEVKVAVGFPASWTEKVRRFRAGVGPCGRAFATRQRVVVGDATKDELFSSCRALPAEGGFRSTHTVPLLTHEGHVIGALTACYPEPHQPTAREMRLLDLYAQMAADLMWRHRTQLDLREAMSELQRSQEAQRAEDERRRELMQALPVAVYTTDATGRIQLYNDAAVDLWGREPDVAHDRWCGSFRMENIGGEALPADRCPLALAVHEGRAFRSEQVVVVRPNGEKRFALVHAHPLRDASGRITGGVNAVVDVTERHRAQETRAVLAAIVECSDDAILSKDLDGIIRSWNAGAERLFGYTAHEAVGRHITMLFPPELLREEDSILDRIRRGTRVDHFETTRRRKDGSLIEVSVTISPVRDALGRITGASKIARDIGERKRAELEMQAARDEALAASRAKDDFLAALSHELRTPLNPVLLVASNAAADARLPEAVRADFAMIRDNVELEARLIDDLLDITRITRGKLALNLARQDLHRILTHALETIRPEIDHKQLTLTYDLVPRSPVVVGDAVRLQQVVWNVVNNAAKFTPPGGEIRLRTRCDLERQRVTLEVSDNGIGMTESELQRIFHAFSQGDHANGRGSHRFGGLGLGLTISKLLIELHHGSISATSAGLDQGATFTIELPLESVLAEPTRSTDPFASADNTGGDDNETSPGPRGRILLVEDHDATRAALTRLLTRRRFEVVAAATAAEARQAAQQGRIDLVISDIGLPDESGYELMVYLRAHHQINGIALTGYGTDQDVAQSQAAGFSTHLTKPVTVQALDQALAVLTMKKN